MLAEIGLAVAAFKTIKGALKDGKELIDCGKAVDQFFRSKSDIQKSVQETRKKSMSDTGDWQEFQNNEKIIRMEKELYEICIYSGRANLWPDWLKFQSDAKKRRDDAQKQLEKDAYARRKYLNEIFQTFFITLCGLGFVGGIFLFIASY